MPLSILRNFSRLVFSACLLLLTTGCHHAVIKIPNDTLATDAVGMSAGESARPGRHQVISTRLTVRHQGENVAVAFYQPDNSPVAAPAIVFLPGRMAPDDQYESYARALASRGFVVAVRGWYSLFRSDIELARDASVIADWLVRAQGVDPGEIGIARPFDGRQGRSACRRPIRRVSPAWVTINTNKRQGCLWCMAYSPRCVSPCC